MNDNLNELVNNTADDAPQKRERPVRPERPPAPPPVPQPKPVAAPIVRDPLTARRTIIPILLTLSVLLIAIGTLTQTMPLDSPLRASVAKASAFFAAGAVSLVLAVLNMRAVRRATRR